MTETPASVEKCLHISARGAQRLRQLAEARQLTEDEIVEKALDILFSLAELFDDSTERQGWSLLSTSSLQRVWDNEQDAAYDDWRDLYGVSAG